MKAPVHVLRRSTRVWLLAGIIVVALLAVTSDSTPGSAATTEIGPTLSATGTSGCGSVCAPAWAPVVYLVKGGRLTGASTLQTAMTDSAPSIINVQTGDGALFPAIGPTTGPFEVTIGSEIIKISARSGDTLTIGGRGQEGTIAASHNVGDGIALQLSPCPENDGATSCLYVWAKNVDALSTGAGAFQIDIAYDSTRVHAVAITGSQIWLGSAPNGRLAACLPGIVDENTSTGAGHASVACNTGYEAGNAPKCPDQCNGLLATLQIESVPSAPAGATGFTVNLSSGTLGGSRLLDLICTPPPTGHCGQDMPATVRSINGLIVKCANLINDPNRYVLINDIVYMVLRFNAHGPDYPNPGDPASTTPPWDERADMDASNRIRINDVTTAVGEYRRSCMP